MENYLFLYKGWHEKNKDIFYVMIGPKVGLKKYLESSQTSSNFTLQQCIVKNHRHLHVIINVLHIIYS